MSANTRFKTENGLYVTGGNAQFDQIVSVSANLNVTGDLLYVGGNLYVQGTQVFVGGQIYATDILASVPGLKIGNTTYQFDVYAATEYVYTGLYPAGGSPNTVPLGNSTNRFVISANTINASGNATLSGQLQTIAGNSNFSTGVLFVDSVNNRVAVNNTTPTTAFYVSGTANVSANVVSTNFISNNATISSNTLSVTSTSQVIIDSFPKSQSSSAKYQVFVKDSTTLVHSIELSLIHEGTYVLLTQYGEIYNTSLGSFDSTINNANVEVYYTATGTPSVGSPYTVKLVRTQIT